MNKNLNINAIRNLPKVELHLHLDCSLSFNVVSKLDPKISFQKYSNDFIAPQKCINLADFLRCTKNSIGLMQSSKNLVLVINDLFDQLLKENVIYAEIRFAPLLHIENGLSPEEVVETTCRAVEKNKERTGIKAGLVLCTLRHFSENQSLKTAELVKKYMNSTSVVGFDIAADEAGFPIDKHIKAFELAIKHDIPRTAHAGEARGPTSIRETLENFKPSRIGHGVRCIEDNELIDYLKKNNIHLEVCPTCNIQTDVFQKYSDHPIDYLYKHGVSIGINTDARTLTNISLTEEYLKLQNTFGWGKDEFKQCNLNALSHAFISESEKEEMKNKLVNKY
jgi:adenosine deaminase